MLINESVDDWPVGIWIVNQWEWEWLASEECVWLTVVRMNGSSLVIWVAGRRTLSMGLWMADL